MAATFRTALGSTPFVFLLTCLLAGPAFSGPVLAGYDARCQISMASAVFDICQSRLDATGPIPVELASPAPANSRLQVIKYPDSLDPSRHDAVAAIGEILDYLPFHAYLVRVDHPARSAELAALAGVQWVGPFLPVWKVDPNVLARMSAVDAGRMVPLSVLVFRDQDPLAVLEQHLSASGWQLDYSSESSDFFELGLSLPGDWLAAAVIALAGDDRVRWLEYRLPMNYHNAEAGWLHQSGNQGQTPLFDRGLYGCGQVVAVLDSGLDFGHCSFRDDVMGNPTISDCDQGAACTAPHLFFGNRKIRHYYKWSGAGSPLGDQTCTTPPSFGHGTHVAGSAVGHDPAGLLDCAVPGVPGGQSNRDGTAPGARLVMQEMGETFQYINAGGHIYHAVEIAHASAARVHNNSWGSGCQDGPASCDLSCTANYTLRSQRADQAGLDFSHMLIVAGSGNIGNLCGLDSGNNIGQPANAKNVLTVGANQRGTSGNHMADFSSRGPTQDRRLKPDVVAQGQAIQSAASDGDPSSPTCNTCPKSGTSMAAPTAAGLAALIRDYLGQGYHPGGSARPDHAILQPTGALVRAILINGASSIDGSGSGAGAPSRDQGWGRVNLDRVLYFLGDANRLWFIEDMPVAAAQSHAYDIYTEANDEFRATLVWHDSPATVGANPTLVNQLRLEVITPAGDTWTQKLPGGGATDPVPFASTASGDYDQRNNVHHIVLSGTDLEAGVHTLQVTGILTPFVGAQRFALVASGPSVGPETVFSDGFEQSLIIP